MCRADSFTFSRDCSGANVVKFGDMVRGIFLDVAAVSHHLNHFFAIDDCGLRHGHLLSNICLEVFLFSFDQRRLCLRFCIAAATRFGWPRTYFRDLGFSVLCSTAIRDPRLAVNLI